MRISYWSSDVCSSDLLSCGRCRCCTYFVNLRGLTQALGCTHTFSQRMEKNKMIWSRIGLAACLTFASLGVAASEQEPTLVTYAAGHRIPATLTLYETKGDPAGRLTPIYNNCRPNISFGSGDIICMFYLTRSEEHTSELQSLMRISYAVLCL